MNEDSNFVPDSPLAETAPAARSESNETTSTIRRGFPSGRALLLIGLALLVVVVGSIGLFYLLAPHQKSSVQPNATATTQAKASKATVTFQNPYTHTGRLVLNDALDGTSNLNDWEQGTNDNGAGCIFTRGAYHVNQPKFGFFHGCIAYASNFSNFVYQVQMMIVQDGSGGLLFRTNLPSSQAYYFSINADSSYTFRVYAKQFKGNARTLTPALIASSAFHAGLYQTNTLAVVANGATLDLYVNLQRIATFHDPTLSSGQIGVFAENDGSPAEVVYSNARVWAL